VKRKERREGKEVNEPKSFDRRAVKEVAELIEPIYRFGISDLQTSINRKKSSTFKIPIQI
jgi:hypothetical protein